MFRATKKKPIKRVILSRKNDDDDDDDIEESPTVVVPLKKGKKRQRPGPGPGPGPTFSFQEDNSKDVNRPTKRGLGFGGVIAPLVEDDLEEETANSALYDPASIEALKSTQKYQKIDPPAIETNISMGEPESYIPLKKLPAETEVIYSGDDAEMFLMKSSIEKSPDPSTPIVEDDDNVPLRWESQVMKRVGLPSTLTSKRAKSLDELRINLSATLSQLQEREDDMQRAYNRRLVEVNFAKEQKDNYQSDLHNAGEALEYYQKLRICLADYVGALRDLQRRLKPLLEAFRLNALGEDRWQEWEGDSIAVLEKAGHLIETVGRQSSVELDAETVIDEFGRNMKAQHVIAREHRLRQRSSIQKVRSSIDGYESDALQLPSEVDELDSRRIALQEALQIALDENDDRYSSLPSLVSIFAEWRERFPQDYDNSHAGMSLADLASVLLQVELCSTHHPLHWKASSRGFSFTPLLKAQSFEENVEETPLYRSIDKVLIPVFVDILKHGAYNIHSAKQSLSMATYFQEVTKLVPRSSILSSRLTNELVDYIRGALHRIAIPIVSKTVTDEPMMVDALNYATTVQVSRIQKILTNLFDYWVPTLGERLADTILDFCAHQFLALLSSLDSPKSEFARVWPNLSQWLNQPRFALNASLLRTAASVYHLN